VSTASSKTAKRRISTSTQVFIGLGLGLLVGLFFGEEVAFLGIGGDIFIAALQITVIPYVVVALITSLGRLTIDDAKALAVKAGAVLLTLWAIGLIVILSSPLAFPDWPSASFFSTSQIQEPAAVNFLQLYIPSNIFASLSNAIVPAIVVFSILFGVALIQVPHKERIVDTLATVGDTLMTITGFIGKLAPYGVFAITASAAGTIDVNELARLQVYIVIYIALSLILSLWVIPALIASLTPLSYGSVLRAFRGPLVTAFATANLLIVLPVMAADAKRLVTETDGQDTAASEQEESVVDILIPAAFPFPNLGLLFSLIFVLNDNADIDALLATDPRPFDALLMPAEEGAAWTMTLAARRLTSHSKGPGSVSSKSLRSKSSSWSGAQYHLTLPKWASPRSSTAKSPGGFRRDQPHPLGQPGQRQAPAQAAMAADALWPMHRGT
jgi:Na+/H+-dicarboxylate symporter